MLPWLEFKRRNDYSQFGEDGYIEAVFEKIGTTSEWCLEVGASDGIYLSNTRRLYEQGWSTVLIESDKNKFDRLCKHSPDAHYFNVGITPTGPDSLDAILAKTSSPLVLDLISIDIDGGEAEIWRNLQKYTGRVVVIEHAYMGSEKLGNSTADQIEDLAGQKGYCVVARTECNSICVPNMVLQNVEG